MSGFRTDKDGRWSAAVHVEDTESKSWFEPDDVGYFWGALTAVAIVFALFW